MPAVTKVKIIDSEKKVNRNTYNISSIKRVTRKFLEVSHCSRAKQRHRNLQKKRAKLFFANQKKKYAARAKFFFLIRPTDFFGCFSCLRPLALHDFISCLVNYRHQQELRFQPWLNLCTLILSKLHYADLVFYPLPQFLLRRLQRVQYAAASFVLGHYIKNFRDVLKIGWLPINERRDLNLLKSCFKALHNTETWPDYLKIIKQECPKELRSSNSIRLVVPTKNGTFQDNAFRSYLTIYQKLLETVKITEPF